MIYTDEEIRLKKELADLGLEIVGFDGWSVMHGVNQGFRCAYCDRDFLASFNDYDSFQLDHITPQSCKGEHTKENTVACCWTCNHLKGSYPPTGNTREARIDDARHYLKERRSRREAELAKVRLLVRGDNSPMRTA
jgi:5-methylcytosine-specific restriction endonuclease McrA